MNKLIQEISSIVSQYGTDIVIEERFVNILKDLYPDRDHPEKFEILKAIIAESISADMYTDCDATTAKSFLEKTTLSGLSHVMIGPPYSLVPPL